MTIKTSSIEYEIHAAPSSPLNLRLGVIYAPRRPRGDFDAYSCVEVQPGRFVVAGWGRGRTVALWDGTDLLCAYGEFASLLGMDSK
jgi:hypothetical protein